MNILSRQNSFSLFFLKKYQLPKENSFIAWGLLFIIFLIPFYAQTLPFCFLPSMTCSQWSFFFFLKGYWNCKEVVVVIVAVVASLLPGSQMILVILDFDSIKILPGLTLASFSIFVSYWNAAPIYVRKTITRTTKSIVINKWIDVQDTQDSLPEVIIFLCLMVKWPQRSTFHTQVHYPVWNLVHPSDLETHTYCTEHLQKWWLRHSIPLRC